MELERYDFEVTGNRSEYKFDSVGPKGIIKKIVKFQPFETDDDLYVNLMFGDWDSQRGKINDGIITNNGDPEKVLATVAFIVRHYLALHPKAIIHAQGRTPSRNRMYQMNISRNYKEIRKKFTIYGITEDDETQLFKRNINYIAFLITSKKI